MVGKPSQFVLDAIAEQVGVDKSRICMVGDRLDTDILFGQQGGLSTMLVLSGEPWLELLKACAPLCKCGCVCARARERNFPGV